jgi:4,5-DOPA dioxygenase extradiol
MSAMPILLVCHGAPAPAALPAPLARGLREVAARLPAPRAVLLVTPDWATRRPAVAGAGSSTPIAGLLSRRNLEAEALDAGRAVAIASAPNEGDILTALFPQAMPPIARLSIQPLRGLPHHLRLGRALRPLSGQGVLVLALGAIGYDLAEHAAADAAHASPSPSAAAFAAWFRDKIESGDITSLLDFRRLAPDNRRNLPFDDRLLPLLVAMGATAAGQRWRRVSEGTDDGAVSLDIYAAGLVHDGDAP